MLLIQPSSFLLLLLPRVGIVLSSEVCANYWSHLFRGFQAGNWKRPEAVSRGKPSMKSVSPLANTPDRSQAVYPGQCDTVASALSVPMFSWLKRFRISVVAFSWPLMWQCKKIWLTYYYETDIVPPDPVIAYLLLSSYYWLPLLVDRKAWDMPCRIREFKYLQGNNLLRLPKVSERTIGGFPLAFCSYPWSWTSLNRDDFSFKSHSSAHCFIWIHSDHALLVCSISYLVWPVPA